MTEPSDKGTTIPKYWIWLAAGCAGALLLPLLAVVLPAVIWIVGVQIPLTVLTTLLTMLAVSYIFHDERRRNIALGLGAVAASFALDAYRRVAGRLRGEPARNGQAYFDPLTNLPNRALLFDRMELALARAKRSRRSVAVLFIDLDGFKAINDRYGHAAGDHLLIAISAVLQATLRASDTAARLGGDEFVVLLDDVAGPREALLVAERLFEALRQPFSYAGHEIAVKVSIGIALSTGGDDRPAELLRRADEAMYRAKRSPMNRYQLYDEEMNEEARRRRALERDLRQALERDELMVYFQPTVRLQTNAVVGAEALVRWNRPEHGVVQPDAFLPLAEETGLISAIDRWVLRQACRQARRWAEERTTNHAPIVSVNLSLRHLIQPTLVAEVAAVLDETGLAPELLLIEIPEQALLADAARVSETIRGLRGLGVRVAVDKFGAGASSLHALRHLSIDYLKIDRSFMAGLGTDPETTSLVSAIITLAHSLGVRVFAQGVETSRQAAWLRELRCDLAQGFYFARPDSQPIISTLFTPSTDLPDAPAGSW